jgi:hypothetical protein
VSSAAQARALAALLEAEECLRRGKPGDLGTALACIIIARTALGAR